MNKDTHYPEKLSFVGTETIIEPLNVEGHCQGLYAAASNHPDSEQLWRYMFVGPFNQLSEMKHWLQNISTSSDPLFFSVLSKNEQKLQGMLSLMNIDLPSRRLEIGNIWFSPEVQNSTLPTEAIFLMLEYAFEKLNMRRVEWKCDNKNEESKRAGVRLGFSYEGLFRQHMIVKNKNRDTAWFSMLDNEWEQRKSNFDLWLESTKGNYISLTKLNTQTLAGKDQ